jgi:fructose-1,6-bisphosphatase II
MTQTEPEKRVGALGSEARFCLCESYARVTERAALAGARWLGRADQETAEEDASNAMRLALELLPIEGRVVIGAGGETSELTPGETHGTGGEEVDLALDPLEGRGVVARGGYGAMSMVAVGEPGAFQTLPDMYMRKMAVGPKDLGAIYLG